MNEFNLSRTTLLCPTCNSLFSTPTLESMPNITPEAIVEADLHRVLPEAHLRAALITLCPACDYCWWTTAFQFTLYNPDIFPRSQDLENSKKFAYAIMAGRQNGSPLLELALLALNGYWCAREGGEAPDCWLKLAGQELELTLQDENWTGNRSYFHYILGEINRLSNNLTGAVRNFNKVGPQAMLPKELIERQKMLAISGDCAPSILPAHLVEAVFCMKTRPNISLASGE